MICEGCSNAINRGDSVRCRYWNKTIATWGTGYKWKEIENCTARNKDPEVAK